MRLTASNAVLGYLAAVQRPEQAHYIPRRRLCVQRKGAFLQILQAVRIAGVDDKATLCCIGRTGDAWIDLTTG